MLTADTDELEKLFRYEVFLLVKSEDVNNDVVIENIFSTMPRCFERQLRIR